MGTALGRQTGTICRIDRDSMGETGAIRGIDRDSTEDRQGHHGEQRGTIWRQHWGDRQGQYVG